MPSKQKGGRRGDTRESRVFGRGRQRLPEAAQDRIMKKAVGGATALGGDLTGTTADATIAPDAVTDPKVGNRTIDPSTAVAGTSADNTGLLTVLLSRLARQIGRIMGGAVSWFGTPPATLTDLASHIAAAAPHSDHATLDGDGLVPTSEIRPGTAEIRVRAVLVTPLDATTIADLTGPYTSSQTDDVTLSAGDSYLVWRETTTPQLNDVYLYNPTGAPTLAPVALLAGSRIVAMEGGTIYGGREFYVQNVADPVIGTDAITIRPAPVNYHEAEHRSGGSDALPWATEIHARGTLSARPAASAANGGYYYTTTDESGGQRTYRSTGSALSGWDLIAAPADVTNEGAPVMVPTNNIIVPGGEIIYVGAYCAPVTSAIESDVVMYMPRPGIHHAMLVRLGTSQDIDGDLVATFRVNGADTALEILIPAGSSPETFIDSTHRVTLAAGDYCDWRLNNLSATDTVLTGIGNCFI